LSRVQHSVTSGVICLSIACALSACAPAPIMLNRAIIRNGTNITISDVTVRHEPTNAMGHVSAILPESEFDLGFSRQPLKGKRAVVTWTTENLRPMRVEVLIPRGQQHTTAKSNHTFTLIYTIQADGTVDVRLNP
jgi:hypothetical protein